MKTTLLILTLLMIGCAESHPRDLKLPPSPRFLIAGQSNGVSPAQSHAPYWSQTGRVTVTDIYHGKGLRIPTSANPMDGSIAWIYLGDYLNRDVTFVNIAIGSQSTRKWRYQHFVDVMEPSLRSQRFDAILWVQGESDRGEFFTEQETYENMKWLIQSSQKIQPLLQWVVAIDSNRWDTKDNPTRRAQKRIIAEGLAFQGPDLDTIRENPAWVEASGDEFVGDGLREHGRLWYEVLKDRFY